VSGAWQKRARWVFWPYAAALFVGTHWPALRIEGPIDRPDLWTHAAVFAVWTILLTRCGYFGPWTGRRNIAWSAVVAVLMGAFDEATQAIPVLQRNAAWDDFLADVVGVALGAGAVWCVRWLRHPSRQ
jgi:VanZ family protein